MRSLAFPRMVCIAVDLFLSLAISGASMAQNPEHGWGGSVLDACVRPTAAHVVGMSFVSTSGGDVGYVGGLRGGQQCIVKVQ